MKFRLIKLDTLPRLAWCALVYANNDEVTVYHGSMVEVSSTFFSAGAWSGSYDLEGFATSCTMSGTGAYIYEGLVYFKSSSDYLSPLFTVRKEGCLFVSNSIVFVMSASGEQPHPLYPFYAYDILRIARAGLDGAGGKLPTNSRHKVQIFSYSTIAIDKSLVITHKTHLDNPPINNYQDYHDILLNGLRGLIANTRDKNRRQPFEPVCTTSRGYDSVAVTCLAVQAGCLKSITINDSRAINSEEDNGSIICQQLGIHCNSYDRWSYLDLPEYLDHLLTFNGLGNTPVLASMVEDLRNAQLFVASDAEGVWSADRFFLSERLHKPKFMSLSPLNDLEFRLEIGYLKFDPSFIGVLQNRKIAEISSSKEMQQWSIGQEYDRPIPRRIAEESGIPRHFFGIKKMHSSHASFSHKEFMCKSAIESYYNFVKKSHSNQPLTRFVLWRIVSVVENRIFRFFYSKRKKLQVMPPNGIRLVAVNNNRNKISWNQRFLYQWSYEMTKDRYAIAGKHE